MEKIFQLSQSLVENFQNRFKGKLAQRSLLHITQGIMSEMNLRDEADGRERFQPENGQHNK